MIDTAGAIYVLGGDGGRINYFNDVWVSTDGGADRTQAVLGGIWGYYWRGSWVYPRGTRCTQW